MMFFLNLIFRYNILVSSLRHPSHQMDDSLESMVERMSLRRKDEVQPYPIRGFFRSFAASGENVLHHLVLSIGHLSKISGILDLSFLAHDLHLLWQLQQLPY